MDAYRSRVSILVVAVLLASCSSSRFPASGPIASGGAQGLSPLAGGTAQTSEGGQVAVVVSWGGPVAGAVFDVKLDTHSVDLDPLDLSNATLANDRGERLSPESWTAPKGGHHREGVLTFKGNASAFFAGTKWVDLVLSGVGGVSQRTLRWEVTG